MKYTTVNVFLIFLLLLVSCSKHEPRTTDLPIQETDIVQQLNLEPSIETHTYKTTIAPAVPNKIEQGEALLMWINLDGDVLHELDVSDASFFEEVQTPVQSNALLIHNYLSTELNLLNLNTRHVETIKPPLFDESNEGYVNSYAANYLFAGWLNDSIDTVIYRNKTVYTYDNLGKPNKIFEASKPIYGSALSPNKQLLALLISSEETLVPEADLIVIDEEGNIVYEAERICYIAHSDGWNFLYPMQWTNQNTIAVPMINDTRGYALVNIEDHTVRQEIEPTLSEEAFTLLKSKLELDPSDVIAVLEEPTTDDVRYLAIQTATQTHQIWLMDLVDKQVTLLSHGTLISWNEQSELVIMQSSSTLPYYVRLNINKNDTY